MFIWSINTVFLFCMALAEKKGPITSIAGLGARLLELAGLAAVQTGEACQERSRPAPEVPRGPAGPARLE
jgi:hypothetical protein